MPILSNVLCPSVIESISSTDAKMLLVALKPDGVEPDVIILPLLPSAEGVDLISIPTFESFVVLALLLILELTTPVVCIKRTAFDRVEGGGIGL